MLSLDVRKAFSHETWYRMGITKPWGTKKGFGLPKGDNIVHLGVECDKWYQSQGQLSFTGVGEALGAKSPTSLK